MTYHFLDSTTDEKINVDDFNTQEPEGQNVDEGKITAYT